jgi:hypothetical protein
MWVNFLEECDVLVDVRLGDWGMNEPVTILNHRPNLFLAFASCGCEAPHHLTVWYVSE